MGVGVAAGDGAGVAVGVGVGVGVWVAVGAGGDVGAMVGGSAMAAVGVAAGGRSSPQAESTATATKHSSAIKMRKPVVIPPIQTAFESVPIQETELPQPG